MREQRRDILVSPFVTRGTDNECFQLVLGHDAENEKGEASTTLGGAGQGAAGLKCRELGSTDMVEGSKFMSRRLAREKFSRSMFMSVS